MNSHMSQLSQSNKYNGIDSVAIFMGGLSFIINNDSFNFK